VPNSTTVRGSGIWTGFDGGCVVGDVVGTAVGGTIVGSDVGVFSAAGSCARAVAGARTGIKIVPTMIANAKTIPSLMRTIDFMDEFSFEMDW
jgi:hypothetical protein